MSFFRKTKSIKQNRVKIHKMTVAKTQSKNIPKFFFKWIVFGLLGVIIWCVWDYTKPSNFPIKHVKIFATYEHVDQGSLHKTIALYLNNGFFYLNVIGLKQRLLEYPWVHAVSVQRDWPDTVIINIVEQQAILRWGMKALINTEGAIFTPPAATLPQDLPVVFGPEEREFEIFSLYQKMLELFKNLNLTIKRVFLSDEHYWEIVLNNNTTLYLKEDDPLNQLELLVKLYKKITVEHDGSPKSIDLRYKSGLAVKWE